MSEYVYDAFISYSHKDIEHARWLQKKLETFRIPRDLECGEIVGSAGNLRIFRDQTDLAGVELQESLQKELEASKYLIVVCSPASAASPWVNEEILYFQSLGRDHRVIAYITEGEPDNEDPEKECYPPAIRSTVSGQHMLGANIQEIGKNAAFLKVASILLDVRFNRLVDRDKKRRHKRILLTTVAAAAVAAVVIGLLARNAVIAEKNRELSYSSYVKIFENAVDQKVNFETGEGMMEEDINALKLSAGEGNPGAIRLLIYCYRNGWGTAKDPEAELYWCQKGMEIGDTTCMVELAGCYQAGTGTEVDEEKAFYWYQQAAEAGDPIGMVMLGVKYEDGNGTEADPEQAFYWYKSAADAGDKNGMEQVARCYRDGIGCEQSKEDAFFWNVKLAEMGNTTAMYNVGLMTQFGFGTKEDPAAAYDWYRKGAEAGDGDCAYMVGWCTENNYGTENAALEWYKRAVELGNEAAQADVDRLEAETAQSDNTQPEG